MDLKKNIPVWVVLCLVVFTASISVAAAEIGLQSVPLIKPWTTSIDVSTTSLQVNAATFNGYDPFTNKYASCSVVVQNYGEDPATPTVQVNLYDASNTVVATGTTAWLTPLSTGAYVSIAVDLVWAAGKTLTNVASGIIVVTG